jgi:hypothetical protein
LNSSPKSHLSVSIVLRIVTFVIKGQTFVLRR